MGKTDIVTKDYISDNNIFADAFNYLLYGGRQVIEPDELREMDTELVSVPYGRDSTEAPIQRYRDKLKYVTMRQDDRSVYILLGIEAQTNVDYAMPVRNMVYDGLQYAKQVEDAAKSHRQKKMNKEQRELDDGKRTNRGEFLSGFYKNDKLIPVVTLVIFFGSGAWDGPTSLHDMFSAEYDDILKYVPDYPINLLCPANMTDEEINLLSSSLREVILFMKYASDEERMTVLMKGNDRFKNLEMKAIRLINQLTNCNLQYNEEKEELDMCKAWDDMRKHERMAGIEIGMLTSIVNLMESMNLTEEKAMEALKIPADQRANYQEKLKNVS